MFIPSSSAAKFSASTEDANADHTALVAHGQQIISNYAHYIQSMEAVIIHVEVLGIFINYIFHSYIVLFI